MIIASTPAQLQEALKLLHGDIGLVMTMGALHDGHLSLVEAARKESDHVVVSIYVNPLQFGPGEDFDAYPRDLEADVAKLEGVDVVFAPTDDVMYPRTPLVRIDPGPVASVLEGKTRPTHFAGVLQVVHKVFNIVGPHAAWFGQKDAQQLALIRSMVADLNMPLDIRAVPIKREPSGLAMSSRNSYLSEREKEQALALFRALTVGQRVAHDGGSAAQTLAAARESLAHAPGVKMDYLELVDRDTFMPLTEAGNGLLVCAAWVGPTRLIDNLEVVIG
ncbi:pantoate--beta-alanine ligase [Arcanobacterium pinnipediorum]|uniref:Pantothenate synthetase n=1 Tax=Arcanobacterium pinnipediorum TaxID=1503041 RepID=A0ABY5AJK4_9ACTO|nr:pantoate--beta-alanine ligase [Arcanobacterium pinnipediorum]USR79621.1 pantoate--beta-alanine ligase [Arcanobacterium pinnipediorum]